MSIDVAALIASGAVPTGTTVGTDGKLVLPTATPPAPAPAPVVATPAPAPTTPAVPDATQVPAWLPERLEQARNSAKLQLAKDNGFESIEAFEKFTKDAKAAAEASKTEAQKQADKLAQLEQEARVGKEALAAVRVMADEEYRKLTDAQKEAVRGVAGDDPSLRLKTIVALRPTWGTQQTPAPPAQAPKVPAITTGASAEQAPAPIATPGSPQDHAAIYAHMKATGSNMAAAQYYATHKHEIQAQSKFGKT